jgi:predicted amidohydrolase
MQDFTIALVQHNAPVGKKAETLKAVTAWCRKAAAKGAKLVLLPELGLTGHAGHKSMVGQAEPVPGGTCVQSLAETARQLGIFICAGIAEDDLGVHYNTQFIVGPGGFVGKQRKIHPSRDEYFFFRGGTDLPVLDLGLARVGIIICFDNEFPEVSRCLAVKGAEVLLCPHAGRSGAWVADRRARAKRVRQAKDLPRRILSVRAYDNGVYVAYCNMAGRAGVKGVRANHLGGCLAIDPAGKCIAESRSRDVRDEMVLADLKARRVAARRRDPNFTLRVRKPHVFGALVEPTS